MAKPDCPVSKDLAAYALGALGPDDVERVSHHVGDCQSCAEEIRWLSPALVILPESVEQVAPPPALRERLLDEVRADAAPQHRLRRSWQRPRLRIGGFSFGPATALATCLIAVAAVVGYEVAGSGGGGERTVAVASTPPGSTAKLELGGGEATLVAQDVPRLPRGAVYQVWVREGNSVLASSAFRPNRDGSAAASVPEAVHGADQMLVTREPRRGEIAPTSAPLYSANLN